MDGWQVEEYPRIILFFSIATLLKSTPKVLFFYFLTKFFLSAAFILKIINKCISTYFYFLGPKYFFSKHVDCLEHKRAKYMPLTHDKRV